MNSYTICQLVSVAKTRSDHYSVLQGHSIFKGEYFKMLHFRDKLL